MPELINVVQDHGRGHGHRPGLDQGVQHQHEDYGGTHAGGYGLKQLQEEARPCQEAGTSPEVAPQADKKASWSF